MIDPTFGFGPIRFGTRFWTRHSPPPKSTPQSVGRGAVRCGAVRRRCCKRRRRVVPTCQDEKVVPEPVLDDLLFGPQTAEVAPLERGSLPPRGLAPPRREEFPVVEKKAVVLGSVNLCVERARTL
jgi:hypothetical protein